jgi:hypothetical protein
MFALVILLLSHSNKLFEFNIIKNNCDFDIIRIKKEDVMCCDLGIYNKYCNSENQPDEFIIYNEKTINKKQITIKPYNLVIKKKYKKKLIANYYYYFTCNNEDNYPKLIQYIVPNPRFDANPVCNLIITILIVLILLLLYYCIYYLNIINQFWVGYLFGITVISVQNYYLL